MCVYGIWRFVIEYARDDYRGFTFIRFITPSQLTAIVMVLGAVALFFVQRGMKNKADRNFNEERAQ
jgi:prolipoprotein diacylglyceryltransferase